MLINMELAGFLMVYSNVPEAGDEECKTRSNTGTLYYNIQYTMIHNLLPSISHITPMHSITYS